MSIQCHPHAEYVAKNHRELGRQDENYYVCVAGEDAKTYLDFKEADSCEKILAAAECAQETGNWWITSNMCMPWNPGLAPRR